MTDINFYKDYYLFWAKESDYKMGDSIFENAGVTFIKEPKYRKKECKLTEHLSVKLEDNKTIIYVDGKKFNQCKYLLLTLDSKEAWNVQEEIKSIDDAAKYLSRQHENGKTYILPETEFWGHCSNLQAWVENNYDLRIIHTNLGFPLLKKLAEYDKKALISLKEEIVYRIEETGYKAYQMHKSTIDKFFELEEKDMLINIIKEKILSLMEKERYDHKYYLRFKTFIEKHLTTEVIEELLEAYKDISFPLRILSSLEIRNRAQTDNHFYELGGVSEYELIMKSEEVDRWDISNEIEADIIYVYDSEGNGVKTGSLTIT